MRIQPEGGMIAEAPTDEPKQQPHDQRVPTPEGGIIAEAPTDELRRRRVHRVIMGDRGGVAVALPHEPIDLLQQRGTPEPLGRRLGGLGRLLWLAQLPHQVPLPGPAEQRHPVEHAAGAVVEDMVPDRVEQQVIVELLLDSRQCRLNQLIPFLGDALPRWPIGQAPFAVALAPATQRVLDQVIGELDRPGVPVQPIDQHPPRRAAEPPQCREPLHHAEDGIVREQIDRDQGVAEVVVDVAQLATTKSLSVASA